MLIEADGAKRKPLKVPADWEPAIPDFADVVVSVIGLDCLGKPICETAHRAEYTSSFLEKSGSTCYRRRHRKIATSVHGLYKNVDHKVYRVYLNKADILPDSSPAEHIVEDLAKQGTIAAYGSLREAEKL
ncbi:MAG: selenium cofactor biosynthesis protein YqeC [Ruminococcus sp.]